MKEKILWIIIAILSIVVIGAIFMFGLKKPKKIESIKSLHFSYSNGYMMYAYTTYDISTIVLSLKLSFNRLKILSPNTGTIHRKKKTNTNKKIINIAFTLRLIKSRDSILYISLEVIIIECVPLLANKKADIRKTAILKLSPFSPTISFSIEAISFGIMLVIDTAMVPVEIDNVAANVAIKAIIGINDKKRKKAS